MTGINNVVLIIFDSLREDCIEGVGQPFWGPVSTPNLKNFLKESYFIEKCYPESLPTLPARRAIYTGQRVFPFTEGIIREKGDLAAAMGWKSLSEANRTMSEILQENGFTTALISDVHHIFKPSKNFHRGFDEWIWIRGYEVDNYRSGPTPTQDQIDYWFPKELQNDLRVEFLSKCLMNRQDIRIEEEYFVATVMRESVRWLEQNQDKDKKFLLVESWSPHEPWFVPQHYRKMYIEENIPQQVLSLYRSMEGVSEDLIRSTQANYSGLVTMCDTWFGYLYDSIKRMGMLDDTLILITTDHGHTIGDRGYLGKRGYPAFPEVFDVPVILRTPDESIPHGGCSRMLVQHTDILPTILDMIGITAMEGDYYKWDDLAKINVGGRQVERRPIQMHGRSFYEAIQKNADRFRDHVTVAWHTAITVVTAKWWFNCKVDGKGVFLYDLRGTNPFDNNVADDHPEVVHELFKIAQEDAGGGFPDFLIRLAVEQGDAPGCSELAVQR